ncbi:MAG: HypC/HybG/HupF family hydrogenase formation chaperone, partial [Hydrogenophaga sp.]|uniref:HypC/HybG/HupF family hydrogenase formation chaperone n=1 Tax=Hydrogenophaga sp. TaxID=1904254 RepID=UPI002AB92781
SPPATLWGFDMCIGMPMQITAIEPGHAWCEGRGERRRVTTALVGTVAPGDWLLVFLGDAREHISAERAAEVNSALDLVLGAMQGFDTTGDAGFVLPSQMSAEQLRQLSGQH